MKLITVKSEALAFYTESRTELLRFAERTIRRMPCPHEFAGTYKVVPGMTLPQWVAVRNALATDNMFMEDVMLDVSVALVRAEQDGRFPSDGDGRRAWAYVVVRRIAQRTAHQQSKTVGYDIVTATGEEWLSNDSASAPQRGFESPERVAMRNVDAAPLFARLGTLSPIERKLLEVAADGGDFTEFADAAGIPAGTVRSAWCRLRKRIRGWAEAEQAEDAA